MFDFCFQMSFFFFFENETRNRKTLQSQPTVSSLLTLKDDFHSMGNAPTQTPTPPQNVVITNPSKNDIRKKDDQFRRRMLMQKCQRYNLKIVVRGSRGTGKTNLIRRLQAKEFVKTHEKTKEIQVSRIKWSSSVSKSDIVKVEVWDVVDEAIADDEKKTTTIPDQGSHKIMPLDASTVDVYKNTDVAIFMIDPFRRDSFEYVTSSISKVPSSVLVVLLLNFRDRVEDESVILSRDEIDKFVLSMRKEFEAKYDQDSLIPHPEDRICVFECSLSNCFGLKVLYEYLNIPLEQQKRRMLIEQLREVNESLKRSRLRTREYVSKHDYASFKGWKKRKSSMSVEKRDTKRSEVVVSDKKVVVSDKKVVVSDKKVEASDKKVVVSDKNVETAEKKENKEEKIKIEPIVYDAAFESAMTSVDDFTLNDDGDASNALETFLLDDDDDVLEEESTEVKTTTTTKVEESFERSDDDEFQFAETTTTSSQVDLISSPIPADSSEMDSNSSMSLAVKNAIQQALLDASTLEEEEDSSDVIKKKKKKKKKRKKKKKKKRSDEVELKDDEY